MMKDIVHCLASDLMKRITEFKKGIAIARIDDEGRVLLQEETTNEFRYAGLNDYDNGYFYIRHRESGLITYGDSPQKKFTGIQNFVRVQYHLRIVACVKNIDPYALESKIRFVLMNADIEDSSTFANPTISPISSQIDSIQVLFEESKQGKPFDKNMIFIAHDFDLSADVDMSLEFYCENPCFNEGC